MEYLTIKYQTTKKDRFLSRLDNVPYKKFILVESVIFGYLFFYILIREKYSLSDRLSTFVNWILFFIWFVLVIIFLIVAYYGAVIKPDILSGDYRIDTEITIHKRFFISNSNGLFSPMSNTWANVKSITYDDNEDEIEIRMNHGGGFGFKKTEWKYNGNYINFRKLFANFHRDWKEKYGIDNTMPEDLQSFLNDLQEANPKVKKDILEEYMTYTCDVDGNVLALQMSSQGITSVPESICKLTSLNRLELPENMITIIPDCLKLLKIPHLDLSGNRQIDDM